MADPTYRYLINDGVTGDPLGEVPFGSVSYSYGLNGVGGFTGTLPLEDPKADASLLRTLSREVLVLRDGVPVFNGPIIALSSDLTAKTINVTAAPSGGT